MSRQVRRRAARANLYWYAIFEDAKKRQFPQLTVRRVPARGVPAKDYDAGFVMRQIRAIHGVGRPVAA